MFRAERLIAATVLIALSCALAGCGTNGSFDPTDAMDWFDTKKKLPGDRRAVFPEGVPGVEQGVPKDLYKGAAQQDQDRPPVVAEPPEPKPKKGGSKSASRKPNSVVPSGQQPSPEAAPDAAPEADDNAVAAAPPAPAPKKQKRRSITAPDADAPAEPQAQSRPAATPAPQQQSAAPFPAPMPSGGFQR